jgi:KDO2-lipid IV(A) lauroyltransferase
MARSPWNRFLRRRRHDLLYILALGARGLALHLPRPIGLSLFGAVGRVAHLLATTDRRRTLAHLRLIYGAAWDEHRIRRTAVRVFVDLGKNLFDAVRLPALPDAALDRIVRCERLGALLESHRAGKGPVAITAHTGCFEMLLPYFCRRGIRGFAVGQRLIDQRLDAMVARARSGPHMEYVSRAESARGIIRRLREGMCFGVLIDQDTNVDGVFAHFLGRLAYTPSGPVRLAMRYGMPLFVVTTTRQADDTHVVDVRGPLPLVSGGEFEHDLVRNVEQVNAVISAAIDAAPEQWVWMHRRWRHTPAHPDFEGVPSIESLGPAYSAGRSSGAGASGASGS